MINTKSTNGGLVSIVTPVYNAANFIAETIETVQNQTYANWELILVNDKSHDNSVEIIHSYRKKDSRIKLIELKTNSGAAIARNAGTTSAKGQYLAFLDADDLWKPTKLELQVNDMTERKYAFSFTGYDFADEFGVSTGKVVIVPVGITYKQSLRNPIIWTSTVLLDLKTIPKKMALMPNVRRGQDAATWWNILRETGIIAQGLGASTAYYRRTNNSLSANKLKAMKRTWYLYRQVEKLSLLNSAYVFAYYGYNAVKKRV